MPDEWVALRNAAEGCFCCCCNGMLEYLWSHETISTIYYINILTNARNSRAQPKLKSVYSTQCLCMCQNGKRSLPPSSVSFCSLSLLLPVWPWEWGCAFSFPKDTSHTPIPEKYIAISFRRSVTFSLSLCPPSQQNANSILHWLFRSGTIIQNTRGRANCILQNQRNRHIVFPTLLFNIFCNNKSVSRSFTIFVLASVLTLD